MAVNAIEVKDVTKVYRLYDKPIDRLKESLSLTHKNYHRDFYALKGLSFHVEKGQTVGTLTVQSGDTTLAELPLTAAAAVERMTWGDLFTRLLRTAVFG